MKKIEYSLPSNDVKFRQNLKKEIHLKENLKLYLKGFLMGICDLIPGISGGTIAFITGIYERLILAIKNITPKNYYELFFNLFFYNKKKFKKNLKKLDILFLFLIFSGIFSAILLGANFISFLLENYYIYLLIFFIGLILSSSIIIFKEIKIHSKINLIFGIFGFILGLIFLLITPTKILDPSFSYIFLGGFLAIFALFLPGISGSFILLILGLYQFIINSVKNITSDFINLIPFALGAILSLFIVSRFIDFLFKKDKCKTLYFLFGLVIGTLFIPLKQIILLIKIISIILFFKLIFLFLLGFFIVYMISKIN